MLSIHTSSVNVVELGLVIFTFTLSPNSKPNTFGHKFISSLGVIDKLSIRSIGVEVSVNFCCIIDKTSESDIFLVVTVLVLAVYLLTLSASAVYCWDPEVLVHS